MVFFMHSTKNRRLSIVSLVMGYFMLACFITLIISTREKENPGVEIIAKEGNGSKELPALVSTEVIDVDEHPLEVKKFDRPVVYANPLVIEDIYDDVRYVDRDRVRIVGGEALSDGRISNEDSFINDGLNIHHRSSRDRVHDIRDGASIHREHDRGVRVDRDYDAGLLDRRLIQDDELLVITQGEDLTIAQDLGVDDIGLDTGGNDDIDATRFELDEGADGDADLGDLGDFGKDGYGAGKGSLLGVGEGSQVYAYSFPSQGVGAGIGSAGVGAAAGYAGIGAGIGQAVLNGVAVATLGGIGTSPISTSNLEPTPENDQDGDGIPALTERELGTDPAKADTDGDGANDGAELVAYSNPLSASSTPSSPGNTPLAQLGGVGGLSNGAGAGAAAGLVTGKVKLDLGMDLNVGVSGADGIGAGQGSCKLDHLPPNGSLHIMMHVDGSGSILDTRKQLDVMKETLLKKALLPYYNNDESLYNKRVTIVDGNGERTLQFFKTATKKDNVLALVFQDEAAPDYHLPTFNKAPQGKYEEDLRNLKSALNKHRGLYRGIMFQVDRGKTFAKSFKEFVESSWNGTGYLQEENLKKYHRDENLGHIKNKDGIVFSDEYHAKSEGNAQYYLDLIFNAANKVGLDLNIHGAGLSDGILLYNKK
jgi:hypothetical protein